MSDQTQPVDATEPRMCGWCGEKTVPSDPNWPHWWTTAHARTPVHAECLPHTKEPKP